MLESVALPLVKYALSEDVGTGDITSLNCIRAGVQARAAIVGPAAGPGARADGAKPVKCGGGDNHRLAVWDMYLVKDNHIRAAGGVTAALDRISRTRQGELLLEVEIDSLDQLREALRPEVDRILVDNRPVADVRKAVELVDRWCGEHPPDSPRMLAGARRWPEVEVSGGLTLERVRAYAETGVDYLSVGALTHSAAALDISLEVEEVG